ncbi:MULTISPECIES: GNAT family N-acetyltransferase [unclassified Pseudomonas]|uniref:GNAT family N-acetyltransferase n=1 Tax=unclassified Pseudomonas TaxID=196821 RepID=UPI00244953CB|nr:MULTISPECIES: GNAT family N-acetyltransferase [unclassified Pseudomonas]MDH0300554.1 GNAT family N-acetyltransferase [Pseudomonas sp. GD04091]MDH1984295.1 GNAT family N-acetyltransferase [Pseudomonas sp. GD03689]
MKAPLTLQTPRYADYPQLARIWEASVRATHDFLPEHYILLLRDHVLHKYLDAVMLVCCRDSKQRILGFAGAANGRVDLLFVDPEFRGQGVGQRLLQHAVAELNAERLDVNEQNSQALGFYLHEGFEVVGRSDTDGLGQPYPLLHMRLAHPPSWSAPKWRK